MKVLRASILYFAVVFTAAFGLGVLRVTLVAPQLGALVAVALEVPIVLAVSWGVAGWIVRNWPMILLQRIVMGILAFVILMGAEVLFSKLLFGQSLHDFMGALATLPGALGLAGQIGFAVIPALRR